MTEEAELEPGLRLKRWLAALAVTAVTGVALGYAFLPSHAGRAVGILTIGATYVSLAIATFVWLRRRGEVENVLAPRRLDVSLGAALALVMYLVAMAVHMLWTSKGPAEAWIIRVYLQVGDPQTTAKFLVGLAILVVAGAEEIVWRGLVFGLLEDIHSGATAWLATSGLYALVHVSTLYLLRDPMLGLNPLVLIAAIGAGLVWGYLRKRFERLGPSLFAHAFFTWAIVEFPLWHL
ncbi:MAG: type II CAAX endopeptidase family protein [Polyangiaceae bacterium]